MNKAVAEKLNLFFSVYPSKKYRKGELLIKAEEEPSGIFYLTEGMVKKYTVSQSGEEAVSNIFAPVSFFPMDWGINKLKNNYYYEAMKSVSLFKAPREDVINFLKKEPDILYDLLSRVYRGIEGIEKKLVLLMSGSAYERLIMEIIIASTRFGSEEEGRIVLSLLEKDLASLTGMTRETVSREMRHLKKKDLIEVRNGQIFIINITLLKSEIGF